jgi:pimeloyl-ACP methyl ester carboxylesterase
MGLTEGDIMKTVLRTLMACVVLVVITLVNGTAARAAENPDPPSTTCTRYVVPVTLSPTSSPLYNLVGWLCTKPSSKRNTTIEVLVPGMTYDHYYWNITYLPDEYSYVYAAASTGWSTFNIDRLGVGQSDKPPAADLTVQTQAYVLEQLIQKLRTGAVDGVSYARVVSVGHSLGAGIAQYAAATATDPSMSPDYLVLADFLNSINVPGITQVAATLIPAAQDSKFAAAGLPDGYLTTQDGTRGTTFYNLAVADPAIVTLDESLKQTGTSYERTTLADARSSATTHAVHVPTLITVGQVDAFYCNASTGLPCTDSATVLTREAPNYSARACVKTWVVINGGHSTNLHYKARDFYNTVNSWLNNYIYNNPGNVDANGCLP